MRLYDLSEQYNDLSEMLEAGEDVQVFLDGIKDAFDKKVESIAKLIRSKSAEMDSINSEVERLRIRAERHKKDVEWLKTYVHTEMERTGKDKIKSSLFNISIRNNPPSVNVLNEAELPQEYISVKEVRSVDKRGILERLKAGEIIPGAEMIQRKSLQIK